MKQTQIVAVVMCTYNGASRHLAEQLDSLFAQTQPPKEIIVQDDCSTDNTMELLADYARRAPHGVQMRVYQNAQQQGINRNFFSAMRRATADLIAVCDQDDIWLPTKLEEQSAAIGQNMMCVCRSVPFTETDAEVRYDSRRPNCNLIRLFYASMMGHCQMLRRELLDVIPTETECPEIYRRTCYDVMTATAAAALDSIVLLDKVLVRQRRYAEAATYVGVDAHRVRSADNAAYMVWYGVRNYSKVKPWMNTHFAARRDFLLWIERKSKTAFSVSEAVLRDSEHSPSSKDTVLPTTDNAIFHDGLRLLGYETGKGLPAFLGLLRMYVRYRHRIFYTHETDPVAFLRAVLHPFMQIYNYRYLVGKTYR